MANNTVLPAGVGGDTIRDQDRAGVKTQIVGRDLNIGGATEVLELAVALADATANPTVPTYASATMVYNGTTWDRLRGTIANGALVDVSRLPALATGANVIGAVTQSGTWNIGSITTMPTTPVTGTFFQATQPVSNAGTFAVQAAATLAAETTKVIGTVNPPAITKGTQGATGVTTQDIKDAGRNQTNYFMAALVAGTATEALQSMTGYKGGVAVAATTTPAVVTAGKTYRVQSITITYVGLATAAEALVNLRANLAGVAAVTSPLVCGWVVGEAEAATAAIAGGSQTITIPFPDGMEFAAGTGIGITVLGQSATGVAAASGFVKVTVNGYEY